MNIRNVIALAISMCATLPAYAGVTVNDAWVKVTESGQTTAEAYMLIKSDSAAKLVGVSSTAAKITQIHEMKMQGNEMQMRAIDSLDLPAGRTIEFKPGGYHIMLSGLSQPLVQGATVPLTLTIEDINKQRQSIEVKIEVRNAMPMGDMKDMGSMKGM
jgi:periplasmic copper chaperone A